MFYFISILHFLFVFDAGGLGFEFCVFVAGCVRYYYYAAHYQQRPQPLQYPSNVPLGHGHAPGGSNSLPASLIHALVVSLYFCYPYSTSETHMRPGVP